MKKGDISKLTIIGIRLFCKENEGLIKFLMFLLYELEIVIATKKMVQLFTQNEDIMVCIGIIVAIIAGILYFFILHVWEALQYAEDKKTSLQEAWEATKPIDTDDF
ncbi:MAG: hypothetical protein HFJ28_00835 [Clostridia bacterium]|nr:hypothetical protein [Clostridia bacterium]